MLDQDRIIKVNIETEMRKSYIDYSMSVIVSRALPDVRDGFKPVHRRILYGMRELGNTQCVWHKNGACVIRWWTVRETSVPSMGIVLLPCVIRRLACS